MAVDQDENDASNLRCPICPITGPPTLASTAARPNTTDPSVTGNALTDQGQSTEGSASTKADDTPDLYWIGCSRCETWFHSVCLLLGGDQAKETVPLEIRNEIETNWIDEGVWTDWTTWVDRWYCPECVAWAADPTNEKRPHHPLIATLDKKTFPPKPRQNKTRKSSPSNTPKSRKKSRLSSVLSEAPSVSSQTDLASAVMGEAAADGKGRPKRQAALNRPDYHALHHHIATPTARWLDLIHNPEKYGVEIKEGGFPKIPAEMVNKAWIESPCPENDYGSTNNAGPSSSTSAYPPQLPPNLFYGKDREPMIITPEDGGFEGLGGKIPGKHFTVADVGRLVGSDRMVDVIDVATQQSSQWPLSKWVDYVSSRNHSDPGPSTKTFNVISLEISGTELAKKVKPPRLVSQIDWVDNFWNFGPTGRNAVKESAEKETQAQVNGSNVADVEMTEEKREVKTEGKGKAPSTWPKVQLYCLMGAKGSWTDWHVDFAASSVYYTIHTGAKTFFFIRPTQKNLAAYAEWSGSYEMQQNTWLGSLCDEVRKVTLRAGDTMILPAGYIHSVYTPEDAIVFGGNFLHSYNIPTQLRLRQIEIDTKVPRRFRFPMFDKLCWYVADRYCSDLRSVRIYRPRTPSHPPSPLPPRVLEGLYALARFLVEQIEILENPSEEDKSKKLIHERIPFEVVKDPYGLARELLWRIKRELPEHYRAEDETPAVNGTHTKGHVQVKNGTKKGKGLVMLPSKPKSRIWNFTPTPWEQNDHPIQETSKIVFSPRPTASSSTSHYGRDTGDEKAEEVTHVYRQSRSRTKDLEDGSTVLEEQDVVFTEKRVIWFPPSKDLGHTIKSEDVDTELSPDVANSTVNGSGLHKASAVNGELNRHTGLSGPREDVQNASAATDAEQPPPNVEMPTTMM